MTTPPPFPLPPLPVDYAPAIDQYPLQFVSAKLTQSIDAGTGQSVATLRGDGCDTGFALVGHLAGCIMGPGVYSALDCVFRGDGTVALGTGT